MRSSETRGEREEILVAAAHNAPAWEMVGPGRYMPRRIRGSFHGRELG
jgi:hypothetical protein